MNIRKGLGATPQVSLPHSPVKGISADELPHEAGGRDLVLDIGLDDVVEHLDHGTHLVVVLLAGLDLQKKRVDILFEHRRLVQRGAVEDDVGVLLEGIDPPLLAATDRIPHGEGLTDRGTAGGIVPHGAAEQAQKAGGNAVVVVQIQGQKRADIHAEDQISVEVGGQERGIEPVQTLDDDDRGIGQAQAVSVPFPLAGFEVEVGELDLLPGQQSGQVSAEELGVDGVDMLKVQLAVGAGGDPVAVDVVVVQTHEDGRAPVHAELGSQAVGRGGLARGAGTGQKHRLGASLADHVGDRRKALLVQGFIDANELADAAGSGMLVEVGDRLTAHQLAPPLALGVDAHVVGTLTVDRHAVGVQQVGIDENEALGGGSNGP